MTTRINLVKSGRARPPLWAGIVRLARRIWRRPSVQHGWTAQNRFLDRLGIQFAAALTYFSFLALVPMLMVAFSVAGFVLADEPNLLTGLQNDIAQALPKSLSDTVTGILTTAVDARLTVGILGLAFALYSGISWMGNLRSAIQAMWRPDFDTGSEIRAESLPVYYWRSLKYLVFLGLAILVSLTLTTGYSWAQSGVLGWMGLQNNSTLAVMATVLSIVLAMSADLLTFSWLYYVVPPRALRPSRRPLLLGAMVTSVAFELLKLGFTYLLPLLLKSATAKLFGPIIGLLFFFNLVATVVLWVAAWIATTPGEPSAAPHDPAPMIHPAVTRRANRPESR